MNAYEALQLAIRLRKKKQKQKQDEPAMTPAPKRPRITREDAIRLLSGPTVQHKGYTFWCIHDDEVAAIRMAIRALKREQKAASKQKETKR